MIELAAAIAEPPPQLLVSIVCAAGAFGLLYVCVYILLSYLDWLINRKDPDDLPPA